MKLVSINVGKPQTVMINHAPIKTGIYKQPSQDKVWLGQNNLEGDDQADLTVHGGEFQAVYSYPIEHYAYWEAFLDQSDLPFGSFGENFTVSGMLEDEIFVGDLFQVGEAIIQATMPRIPCFKFGHRIGRPDILQTFLASGRSGFYHKVMQEGYVQAGDAIVRIAHDPNSISIRQALGLQKLHEGDAQALEHALSLTQLPPLLRETYQQRLLQMLG